MVKKIYYRFLNIFRKIFKTNYKLKIWRSLVVVIDLFIKIDNKKAQFYYLRARTYYNLGLYKDAADSYLEAINRSNNNGKYYFNLALCYKLLNKKTDLIEITIGKAIQAGYASEQAYIINVESHLYQKRYKYAFNLINDYLNKYTNNSSLLLLKIDALMELKRYKEAIAIAYEDIGYKNLPQRYSYQVGYALYCLEDVKKSIKIYTKLNNTNGIMYIANQHAEHKRYTECISECEKILNKHNSIDAHYLLAECYEYYANFDKSIETLQLATKKYPEHHQKLNRKISRYYHNIKDYNNEVKTLEKTLKPIYKGVYNWSSNYARALYYSKKYKKAADYFMDLFNGVDYFNNISVSDRIVAKHIYKGHDLYKQRKYAGACQEFIKLEYIYNSSGGSIISKPSLDYININGHNKLTELFKKLYLNNKIRELLFIIDINGLSDIDNKEIVNYLQAACRRHVKRHQWEAALHISNIIIKINKYNISEELLLFIIKSYRNTNDYKEAAKWSGVALKEFNNSFNITLETGLCLIESGDPEKALALWKKYIENNKTCDLNELIHKSIKVSVDTEYYDYYDYFYSLITEETLLSTQQRIDVLMKSVLLIRGGFAESTMFDNTRRINYYNIKNINKQYIYMMTLIKQCSEYEKIKILSKCTEIIFIKFENMLTVNNNEESIKFLEKSIKQSIDNNECDELIDYIVKAIYKERIKHVSSSDYQEKIIGILKTTRNDILTVPEWLLLYDILLFNKCLTIACAIRDKATGLSRSMTVSKYLTAKHIQYKYSAHVESKEYSDAINTINKAYLSNIINKMDYINKHNFVDVLSGYREYFRYESKLINKNDKSEKIFTKLIEKKIIALVGPALTQEKLGKEIDNHDTIIRFNYSGVINPESGGSRSDISYHNGINVKNFLDSTYSNYINEVKIITSRFNFTKTLKNLTKIGKYRAYYDTSSSLIFHRGANAVPKAILDILKYKPTGIKVFKSNFYMTNKPYERLYSNRNDTKDFESDRLSMVKFQEMSSAHDPILQLNLMRNLRDSGIIEVDNTCGSVLDMTNEEYMSRMEDIFEFK